MSERIYVRDAQGDLVAREGGRAPGKIYSDIGRDPDGAVRLREWSDADVTAHEAQVAAGAARDAAKPKAPSLDERIAALEAALKQ